jgi:hypothetical protein
MHALCPVLSIFQHSFGFITARLLSLFIVPHTLQYSTSNMGFPQNRQSESTLLNDIFKIF